MIKNQQQLRRARRYATTLRSAIDAATAAREPTAHLRAELDRVDSDIERFVQAKAGRLRGAEFEDLGDLADLLVLARVARGMTQQELAAELDVSQQQVQKWEAGGYHASSLRRLSDVFDVLELDVEGRLSMASDELPSELWNAKTSGSTSPAIRVVAHPTLESRSEAEVSGPLRLVSQ